MSNNNFASSHEEKLSLIQNTVQTGAIVTRQYVSNYINQLVNVVHHALIAVVSLQTNRLISDYIDDGHVNPSQIHVVLVLSSVIVLYSMLLPKIQFIHASMTGNGGIEG